MVRDAAGPISEVDDRSFYLYAQFIVCFLFVFDQMPLP
jgi:hypothetical protein